MADEFTKAALYGIKTFNKKAKEKIGMMKLINLLNEYEGQDTWSYDEEMGMPYYGWGDDCDYEAYLISKKYGFIKWLVENDKIDFNKDAFISLSSELGCTAYDEKIVLMVLSISDTPIEDLLLYLK